MRPEPDTGAGLSRAGAGWRRAWLCTSLLLLSWSFVGLSRAQAPPWFPTGSVPLSADTASLEVINHDAPIWFEPRHGARRRGSTQIGARLPVFGFQAPHASCRGRWFAIGPEAWLCEEYVRLSRWTTTATPLVSAGPNGLPYQYHFVGADGSFGYANLRLADEAVPDSQLEPGFAVALRRVESKSGGEAYGLTTHGLWLPLRDLLPASVPTFEGQLLSPGAPLPAWVHRAAAKVFTKPWHATRHTVPRLSRVDVLEQVERGGRTWFRIAEDQWLRADDVRRAHRQEPPAEALPDERWLDVDTESQTLVAYQGEQAVFATLISTGKGTVDSPQATPLGTHRVWVKLVSTDMTNLEDADANRFYAIEEVPWVMFFKGGYGLHGAFWHESFGTKRSHGCINLSPRDAHFLFEWAGPQLPPGWHAVHPTDYDRGTLVVVR